MKIALLNPGNYGAFQPPLGLGFLASYLREFVPDVTVRIFDENAGEDAVGGAIAFGPDLIGITATTPLMVDAVRVAETLKKSCSAPVVLGGYHVSALAETTMRRNACFDVAALGEGEETLGELARLLAKEGRLDAAGLARIPGVAWREGDAVRFSTPRPPLSAEAMNRYPPPARDLMNMDFYLRPRDVMFGVIKRATQMMTSRGCPYDCRFCGSKTVNNRRWRSYSPERVIGEMRSLSERYGVEAIFFQDDMFSVDKNRAREICNGLIAEGLNKKISWIYSERANFADGDLMRLYRQAGCEQVTFGFESGSERVLTYLKKDKSSVAQNQAALDTAVAAGLRVTPSFMIGNYGETLEEMGMTLDFIRRNLDKMTAVQLYIATPYPGSVMWDDWAAANGVNPDETDWGLFWMGLSGRKAYAANLIDHGELERIYNRELLKLQYHYNLRFGYLAKKFLDNPLRFAALAARLAWGSMRGGAGKGER